MHLTSWMSNSIRLCLLTLVVAVSPAVNAQKPIVQIRLHLYEGYAESFTPAFMDAMEEKYQVQIKVDAREAIGTESIFNSATEKKSDVISISHNDFKSHLWPFISNGLLLALDLSMIPNYENVSPIFQRNTHVVDAEGNVYGLPFVLGLYSLAYNADIIHEEPTSWNILWNEDYIGKYSICSTYPEGNILITALSLGAKLEWLHDYATLFRNIPLNTLRTKLNLLSRNTYSFWEVSPSLEEMENLALVTSWGYTIQMAQKAGMNWKLAYPKEGTTAWFDHLAITTAVEPGSVKHKICMDWLNYCISEEIQTQEMTEWGIISVLKDMLANDQVEIHRYGMSNEEFWEMAITASENSEKSERFVQALWKYAMTQKDPSITFKENYKVNEIIGTEGDTFQTEIHHSGEVYERGLRLARERRSLLSHQKKLFPMLIPQEILSELTRHSIKSGKTKQEIILEAIAEHLAKQPASTIMPSTEP
jgi:spermidine/putrescine-binding protein